MYDCVNIIKITKYRTLWLIISFYGGKKRHKVLFNDVVLLLLFRKIVSGIEEECQALES